MIISIQTTFAPDKQTDEKLINNQITYILGKRRQQQEVFTFRFREVATSAAVFALGF